MKAEDVVCHQLHKAERATIAYEAGLMLMEDNEVRSVEHFSSLASGSISAACRELLSPMKKARKCIVSLGQVQAHATDVVRSHVHVQMADDEETNLPVGVLLVI